VSAGDRCCGVGHRERADEDAALADGVGCEFDFAGGRWRVAGVGGYAEAEGAADAEYACGAGECAVVEACCEADEGGVAGAGEVAGEGGWSEQFVFGVVEVLAVDGELAGAVDRRVWLQPLLEEGEGGDDFEGGAGRVVAEEGRTRPEARSALTSRADQSGDQPPRRSRSVSVD
jgi:hypothetical protein